MIFILSVIGLTIPMTKYGSIRLLMAGMFGQVSKLIGGRTPSTGITLDQVMRILMPQRKYGAFSKSFFRYVTPLPN